LWKNAEVDYRVPLFRVCSEHRATPWPDLLNYWGLPNLQVINRDVHAVKCAIEARDRRAIRSRSVCDKESKWLPAPKDADFYLVDE